MKKIINSKEMGAHGRMGRILAIYVIGAGSIPPESKNFYFTRKNSQSPYFIIVIIWFLSLEMKEKDHVLSEFTK